MRPHRSLLGHCRLRSLRCDTSHERKGHVVLAAPQLHLCQPKALQPSSAPAAPTPRVYTLTRAPAEIIDAATVPPPAPAAPTPKAYTLTCAPPEIMDAATVPPPAPTPGPTPPVANHPAIFDLAKDDEMSEVRSELTMSEVTPAELQARQAYLDAAMEQLASTTGVYMDGGELMSDGSINPYH